MRRLLPGPATELTVDEAAAWSRPRPAGRPWVALCMIASIDGSTALDDRSGGLSGPTDVAMLGALRRVADVVLVGAGTARAEGYGPPRKPGQRIAVVTNSGRVDAGSELFRSGAGYLVAPDTADTPAGVEVLRAGHDRVDLRLAMAQIDAAVVQAEGGPTLNAALAEADLLDELNVTVSPMLAGGPGARVVADAGRIGRRFELGQLVEDDGFLFARWLRRGGRAGG